MLDRADYDDERGELGGHSLPTSAQQPRIHVTQRICHKGEVNRARYMPQNPDLLATKAVTGDVPMSAPMLMQNASTQYAIVEFSKSRVMGSRRPANLAME